MQYVKSGTNHLIKVEPGERIVESLHSICAEKGIRSGRVSAIGAATDVVIGYFDMDRNEYLKRTFADNYEVIGISGNVATVDGAPFAHLHILIGDADYRVFGGHLFEGTVTITLEVTISEVPSSWERTIDERTGLKLWDLGTAK